MKVNGNMLGLHKWTGIRVTSDNLEGFVCLLKNQGCPFHPHIRAEIQHMSRPSAVLLVARAAPPG